MDTPHQDALIVAKLEDAIAEISAVITSLKRQPAQGDPDAATERAWYARQLNAYKRALRYWGEGLRPRAYGNGYLVPSGSTPGKAPYYVERHGEIWVCDPTCKHCGDIHWHTAIVGVLEQLPELAAAHDDGDVVIHESTELATVDAWQLPDYDEPWLPSHTERAADPEARPVVLTLGARIAAARRAQAQRVAA